MSKQQNRFSSFLQCLSKLLFLLGGFLLPENIFNVLASFYHSSLLRLLAVNSIWKGSEHRDWANLTYRLVQFLSITQEQFNGATRPAMKAAYIPFQQKIAKMTSFYARPTLFLRVITPNGFSIVVRALLDTGSTSSLITTQLATLLHKKGNVSIAYQWPFLCGLIDGSKQTYYRTLSGLQLQSVENEQGLTIDVFSDRFIIDERYPYDEEPTPLLTLVAPKMASIGLPMISSSALKELSQKDAIYEYRFELVIGQDLLSRYFLIKPFQPTYHLTPFLALVRTTMGLTLLGFFEKHNFDKWTPPQEEVARVKEALLVEGPKKQQNSTSKTLETAGNQLQLQLKKALTFDSSKLIVPNIHYKFVFYLFIALLLYLHIFLFFFLMTLLTFILHLLIVCTFLRYFAPLVDLYSRLYTALLKALFQQAVQMQKLYKWYIIMPCYSIFDCIAEPQEMPFKLCPRLVLNVSSGSLSQTVNAVIDTGNGHSRICSKLIKDLQLVPKAKSCGRMAVNVTIRSVIDAPVPPTSGYLKNESGAQIELICVPNPSNCMPSIPSEVLAKVGPLLGENVTFSTPPESLVDEINIGTDLIPSFLLMAESSANQCITLATDNLTAIQTRFGWTVQGGQIRKNNKAVYNWKPFNKLSLNDWRYWLLACFVFDFFVVVFLLIN